MIDKLINENCTGCESCALSCPQSCIRMVPDKEGFKQPEVDPKSCIKCKKCVKVCPVLNFQKYHQNLNNKKIAYAFKADNEEYRRICSSGGVFLTLANSFVEQGGVIYGAAFDKEFKLSHVAATTSEELVPLAGSKYLQSNINDAYKEIRIKLQHSESVLFFGTTCQVEGLRAYLGKDYNNLFCVDLICMGIPSPLVWDKYLEAFYDRKNIKRINFKDKSLGWHRFSFCLENKDGSIVSIPGFDNSYMECMFKGYSIRKSCFHCIYKCESKISDITIADCWGCEKYISEMDDNKGLSMIICHSGKSDYLIDILRQHGKLKSFDYVNVLKYNSNYNHSTTLKSGRSLFFGLLNFSPQIAFSLMGKNPNRTILRRVIAKIKVRSISAKLKCRG